MLLPTMNVENITAVFARYDGGILLVAVAAIVKLETERYSRGGLSEVSNELRCDRLLSWYENELRGMTWPLTLIYTPSRGTG